MASFNRLRVSSIVFSVIYWMLAAVYFVILRFLGLGENAPPDLEVGGVLSYASIVGISIGLLFGVFPFTSILGLNKRRSFLTVVLIGTIAYILFFLTVIFISSLYGNSFSFALNYIVSPDGLLVLFHLSACSLLYHFILQINKKFGPGVLLEYAFGRYFAPKAEERAFMFLDLKSSTRIAETLEHISYSSLIQDCYAELTSPLLEYKAHVYQYVGDEVVVSWKMDGTFSGSFCHEFFFAFQQRLASKKDYFLRNYGVQPEFKAGVHCGQVMVAEVGEIKTEIAYHGDVLNTASRIQSLCNRFEKSLLLSQSIVDRLNDRDRSLTTFVGEEALRGKETRIRIYAVNSPSLSSF